MSVAQTRASVLNGDRALIDSFAFAALGSAFMALCSHAAIPLFFTPVPLSLANFGVLVLGLTLGRNRALAALVLYLVEGAAGLPVFAPTGPGGIAQLVGPTGGFLLAYPAVAYLTGWLFEKRKTFIGAQLACVAGEVLLFAVGIAWFKLVTDSTFAQALAMAALPFLAGEVLKVFAASAVGTRAAHWLSRIR